MSEMAGLSSAPRDATSGVALPVSAGALLREAREAAGLHIGALAVSLKVPVKKLEALEDVSYTVREIAVETLAKLKDRKVTPFLLAQLGAPKEDYIEKVIIALGELGDARSEQPLAKFTRHKNPKLRVRLHRRVSAGW